MTKAFASILLFLVFGVASAQHQVHTLVTAGNSYANDDIDTVTVAASWGEFNNVVFVARAADSISITKVYVDRSPVGRGAASYSVYDSLSTLADTHNSASVVGGTLRGPTVDKMGGGAWQYRLRIVFASSANGTSSPTYGAYLYVKP